MSRRPGIKIVSSEPSHVANEISEFYGKIIPNLHDVQSQDFLNNVKRELKEIRRLKHFLFNKDEESLLVNTKFDDVVVRCAYMYSYSVLDTCIVYREFSKHLKANKETFTQLFLSKRPTLKICCLAGGSGTEALGVCKAIRDAIWKFESDDKNSVIDVFITVVDLFPEWQKEELPIAKALNNDDVLFPSMRIRFHVDFFEADLLQAFKKKMKNYIKEADVVTVVSFMCAIYEKRPVEYILSFRNMMKSVIGCMPTDSCLFMLEPAGGVVFYQVVEGIFTHRNAFERQMQKHHGYSMHSKTIQKLESMMDFRKFTGSTPLFPTLMKRVSSCIWTCRKK